MTSKMQYLQSELLFKAVLKLYETHMLHLIEKRNGPASLQFWIVYWK